MFIGHQSIYKRDSKDTVNNAKDTGEFVWNMATYELRENINATALESWDDEFPLARVTKVASKIVKPPRVSESPVQFECKVHSILRITGDSLVGHSDIVIGRVVGIHVRGDFGLMVQWLFDVLKAAPLARLGYHQYTAINNIFDMDMPFMPDDHVSGNVLGGFVSKNMDGDIAVENGTEERRGCLGVEGQ
ncbi:hypothetical protein DSL72_001465 [Monilinia vaccinii-corymbosi]|uniref:Flavin reductase like domain-containing protein n=1 Tax=Monilinia vaccinii-corymbosi TaxID=61207 RepID=A0A8A3P7F7_9HELO|nr:hypothetical protein DSL72_001465 [Monilinia vaccinii-corymbosi]